MFAKPAKFRRVIDEPTMSDNTLLLKVDDLIAITFGTGDTNIINFKLLHSILLILASQMRMLEQDVEIRFAEEDDILTQLKQAYNAGPEAISKEESSDEDEGISKKDGKGTKGGKKGKGKTEVVVEKKEKKKKGGLGKEAADDSTSMYSRKMSVSVGSAHQETPDSLTRIGSIEVVTASKFNLLESMVQSLLKRTGGVPLPTMPSNEDLLAELAKGTASLPDTMDAMRVNARVKAAEEGLTRMAGLLTQLAASGALPPEVADIIAQMQIDLQQLALGEQPEGSKTEVAKTVATDAPSLLEVTKGVSGTVSVASAMSKMTAALSHTGNVTHPEMFEAMQNLEQELMKNVEIMTMKSRQVADQANLSVKTVVDKMDIATKISSRITTLSTILTEYTAQLTGFDSGLTSQLTGFRDQMGQLQNELTVGILQLQSAGANTESSALMELRNGYECVIGALEQNMTTHGALATLQKQLTEELKFLVENVEMLREQKADRDEVADGLRDKANINRLKGLLRQSDFDKSRSQLEKRLNLSYDKFSKQEQVWLIALKDLNEIAGQKANMMHLLTLKDYTTKALNEHKDMLRKLEYMLGEPKTAMLTRQLARSAQCGPCAGSALMDPFDKRSGAPPRLPALLRHREQDEPCLIAPRQPPDDYNKHVCKRWVGGSHTLLTEHVAREQPAPAPGGAAPTKQYTGHGDDGRLYHMEEELQPCVECNKVPPALGGVAQSTEGGGDVACDVVCEVAS